MSTTPATPRRTLTLPQTRILRMMAEGPWALRSASGDYTSSFAWFAPNGTQDGMRDLPIGLPPAPTLVSSSLVVLRDAGAITLTHAPHPARAMYPYLATLTSTGVDLLGAGRTKYATELAADEHDALTARAMAIASHNERCARLAQQAAEDALIAKTRALIADGRPLSDLNNAVGAVAAADALRAASQALFAALRDSNREAARETMVRLVAAIPSDGIPPDTPGIFPLPSTSRAGDAS